MTTSFHNCQPAGLVPCQSRSRAKLDAKRSAAGLTRALRGCKPVLSVAAERDLSPSVTVFWDEGGREPSVACAWGPHGPLVTATRARAHSEGSHRPGLRGSNRARRNRMLTDLQSHPH